MFGKNQVQVEAVYLNRLMFPYILFIGMAALAMAHFELLSHLRHARGDAHFAEYFVYRFFDGGSMETFFKPGGGAGGRRAGGRIFCSFFCRCRNWSRGE